MSTELARQKAAQVWCKPETKKIIMDRKLAEAFAETLDEIWSQPWLGNATNEEMLDELRARFEVDGKLYYATTKCENQPMKGEEMKVSEFIEKLKQYNKDANFEVIVRNCPVEFEINYGNAEGVTKKDCERVCISINDTSERVSV